MHHLESFHAARGQEEEEKRPILRIGHENVSSFEV
jgi:hypothetical protein